MLTSQYMTKLKTILLGDFNARTGVLSDRMETTDTKYEDENVILDNDQIVTKLLIKWVDG